MERRELFSSFAKLLRGEERQLPTYPPYFSDEADFQRCRECDDTPCVKACEEGIIEIVDGVPSLDFFKSGCTFCDQCALTCPLQVLRVDAKRSLPPLAIDPIGCLAWHGTICSSCRDACLDQAIEFTGLFQPQIIAQKCTGCGFCVGVCPTKAIGR
ncbi:MAG: 4Fe-4S ferredoxin [Nitratiruptor sp.]|nr:4Fe-4S ferredoxin [Nitratiruptor sp.]NPA83529.1 4Fe-4S ferredoxin [Campylobacterota bacterium]